jgi:superoxide dismutase, Cu-Zn family
MRSIAAIASSVLLAACATGKAQTPTAPPPAPRTAWIVNNEGASVGQATFTETPDGVLIKLEFSAGALPSGWHGAHLHEHGDCADAAAGFHAAGGHIGHGQHVMHGLENPAGPEAGDLPNLFAPAAEAFGAEFLAAHVTLGTAEGRMPLLDGDGSALIIHALPDDQMSQPIGGAGARLACAALTLMP